MIDIELTVEHIQTFNEIKFKERQKDHRVLNLQSAIQSSKNMTSTFPIRIDSSFCHDLLTLRLNFSTLISFMDPRSLTRKLFPPKTLEIVAIFHEKL